MKKPKHRFQVQGMHGVPGIRYITQLSYYAIILFYVLIGLCYSADQVPRSLMIDS